MTVATLHGRTATMASFKCLGGVGATGPRPAPAGLLPDPHPRDTSYGQAAASARPRGWPCGTGSGEPASASEQRCPPAVSGPTWSCCCRTSHGATATGVAAACGVPPCLASTPVSDLSFPALMETKCRGAPRGLDRAAARPPAAPARPCSGSAGVCRVPNPARQLSVAPSVLR